MFVANSRRMSAIVLLFASMIIFGCGKKGALYLPDQPRPAKQVESR